MNDMIKLIQQTRLKKGYNFFDIEQATGIPTKKMHSFEKGLSQLSLDELDKLFVFLGIQQAKDIKIGQPKKRKNLLLYTGMATLVLVAIMFLIIVPMLNTDPDLLESSESPAIGLENEQSSTSNADDKEPSNAQEAVPPVDSEDSDIKEENTTPEVVAQEQGVQFRFWGNMPYQSQSPPTLGAAMGTNAYEVFTVEGLIRKEALPAWLSTTEKESTLLNLATRYIWDEVEDDELEAVKERDRLNKLGIKNMGLDYSDTVTSPYILDTTEGKIGILPFTRHILHPEHLAEKNEIGLARAANAQTITSIIQKAKQEVDFLIVMVGWGDRNGTTPVKIQKDLAKAITAAGADIIIGNHPVYGQEITQVNNIPVFYSLGASISTKSAADAYSFVLDIDIVDRKLSQMTVHVGKLVDGTIMFDLSDEEKQAMKDSLLTSPIQELVDVQ